ncbi:MAG: GIY-YIG nuclease family protein [Nitrospira sp. SB0666_bin_27]|nr:GIY-YIG nuclease family protein [Nitrospira sp. SB0666_bin_27]MYC26671.1 GIY-YIG nuclease family protein [Nitrospira sp. SB0662_bin_26]MYF24675.1 GIY-YIG nuclease family protein [Nitrospira sp. SB0678_bin_10]
MNHHTYYVYIMASKRNGTLYIGVTNDLIRRVYEHKNNLVEGFTNRYRVHTLVYWEQTENIEAAIQREKQLKKWKRQRKLALIEEYNADWDDLYEQLL